jgi:phosphatidylinositol alpha-mannosyltransferase
MPFSPFMSGRILTHAAAETKLFGTFHILPYGRTSTLGTKMLTYPTKRIVQQFSKVFAVSQPAQQFFEKMYRIPATILPNPIDYFALHSGIVRSNSKKIHIVYLGRFDKRKGVRQLLHVYASLPDELRHATQLTMCGKGPLLEEMKQTAAKNRLGVHFPGFVDNSQKKSYLADADIAVFPSTSGESFGIVLLEAMAVGAGITIGGNNPGYASVLHPWPSTLFNPNASEEFKQTLVHFITHATERRKIGSAQHAYVRQFDARRVVTTLLHEYELVLRQTQ